MSSKRLLLCGALLALSNGAFTVAHASEATVRITHQQVTPHLRQQITVGAPSEIIHNCNVEYILVYDKVSHQPSAVLPYTGSTSSLATILSGVGLISLSGYVLLKNRKTGKLLLAAVLTTGAISALSASAQSYQFGDTIVQQITKGQQFSHTPQSRIGDYEYIGYIVTRHDNCLKTVTVPNDTPEKPETPQTPDKPQEPKTPENPNIPSNTPETPNTPEQPEKPETPETPNTPDTPKEPEQPVETPKEPEQPIGVLEEPEQPINTPNEPETPDTPNKPQEPEQPIDVPGEPEQPIDVPNEPTPIIPDDPRPIDYPGDTEPPVEIVVVPIDDGEPITIIVVPGDPIREPDGPQPEPITDEPKVIVPEIIEVEIEDEE